MAYLYNKDEGANSYTIQRRANIPSSQESNRFKGFLEELCELSCLKTQTLETGGEKPRINYYITEKGKKTVDLMRNPLVGELIGPLEEEKDRYKMD